MTEAIRGANHDSDDDVDEEAVRFLITRPNPNLDPRDWRAQQAIHKLPTGGSLPLQNLFLPARRIHRRHLLCSQSQTTYD